jgi:cardiolipin synthase
VSHFDFFLSPVQHIISILIFFLTLIFSASLVQSRRSPGAALAWLLVIALMPYVGIPLYFLLGGRKIRRAASFKENLYSPRDKVTIPKELSTIEKILLSAGVPDRTTDNHISLISDGVVAYETILKIIDKAKESIYVETFILGKDQVGKSILKA